MWQEARKQEKKLRGMMVDHKRRAERRREYYEKIKLDPTQFLQVHGRRCKIHLDPAVSAAADSPATMMPWQGNKDISIDRFDVRAHLDYIAENHESQNDPENDSSRENRETNYERYRILIQNDFLRIPEEKFLRTIELEEKYGGKTYQAQKAKDEKKKTEKSKAAIGFVYEDSTAETARAARPVPESLKSTPGPIFSDPRSKANEDGDVDSDSDIDLDMTVDIMALGHNSQKEINLVGKEYNLGKADFIKYLARDIEEQQELKTARQQEEEKAMFSGRKSRRERRMIRERRLVARKISPPSYATRSSPSYEDSKRSRSNSSRSLTPENNGKVEFITSFGGESDEEKSGSKSRSRLRSSAAGSEVGPTLRDYTRSSSSERRRQRSTTSLRESSRHGRSRHRESPGDRSRSGGKMRRKQMSSEDTSSSESSDEGREMPNRYRSKYRNRRRSSSVSSDGEDKKLSSPLEKEDKNNRAVTPEVPIKRYYDRIREHIKDDDDSDLTDLEDRNSNTNGENKYRDESRLDASKDNHSANKVPQQEASSNSVKDKIRKRMQAQIKRQFKIDKLAEEERKKKLEEERLFREEEMRDLALKLRKKERERRHQNYGSNSSDDNDVELSHGESKPHLVTTTPTSKSIEPKRSRRSRSASAKRDRKRRSRSRSRHSPRKSQSRRSRSRSRGSRRHDSPASPSPRRPRLVDY